MAADAFGNALGNSIVGAMSGPSSAPLSFAGGADDSAVPAGPPVDPYGGWNDSAVAAGPAPDPYGGWDDSAVGAGRSGPGTRNITVKSGQTLERLAGTSDPKTLDRIAEYNGLRSRHEIRAGQSLVIPDADTLAGVDVSSAVAKRGAAGAAYYAERQAAEAQAATAYYSNEGRGVRAPVNEAGFALTDDAGALRSTSGLSRPMRDADLVRAVRDGRLPASALAENEAAKAGYVNSAGSGSLGDRISDAYHSLDVPAIVNAKKNVQGWLVERGAAARSGSFSEAAYATAAGLLDYIPENGAEIAASVPAKVVAGIKGLAVVGMGIKDVRTAENIFGAGADATRAATSGAENAAQHMQLKDYYKSLDPDYTPLSAKRIPGNEHPVNFEKANTVHSVRDGAYVRFTPDGYPDFEPVSALSVDISMMTGNRRLDFKMANESAGFGSGAYSHQEFFPNHIWHHHQNGRTMMLVPEDYHAVGHSGGDSIAKK